MKNPCEDCIIKMVCKYLCEDSKEVWMVALKHTPDNIISKLTDLVTKDDKNKTMHWWFEELIRELKERN